MTDLSKQAWMTHAENPTIGAVLAATGFDNEASAVRPANDTIYGLAAFVWTGSISRAHRVSHAIKAGIVSVNTADAFSAQTPFGGVKQSGMGRDLSLHALDKYTVIKATLVKHRENLRFVCSNNSTDRAKYLQDRQIISAD